LQSLLVQTTVIGKSRRKPHTKISYLSRKRFKLLRQISNLHFSSSLRYFKGRSQICHGNVLFNISRWKVNRWYSLHLFVIVRITCELLTKLSVTVSYCNSALGLFRVLEWLEPARAQKSSSFIFELKLLYSLKKLISMQISMPFTSKL